MIARAQRTVKKMVKYKPKSKMLVAVNSSIVLLSPIWEKTLTKNIATTADPRPKAIVEPFFESIVYKLFITVDLIVYDKDFSETINKEDAEIPIIGASTKLKYWLER